MAGEAKSDFFLLGAATVMIGPQAEVMNLQPATHSIGLVKNFALTQSPSYINLTQGVQNQVVASALTSNEAQATMEVYEATAKNITYGLGLDGSAIAASGQSYIPTANIAAAATSVVLTGDLSLLFTVGDWIQIRQGDDKVHLAKLSAVAFSTPNTTLTFTAFAVPTGVSFTAASTKVTKATVVPVGSTQNQPYFGAKVVGIFSNGQAATLIFPRIRIVNGFNLSFNSDNFGNLPFEFTPYASIPSDPLYNTFAFPESAVQMFMV